MALEQAPIESVTECCKAAIRVNADSRNDRAQF
jgi:hypothetical protein